MPGRVAQLSQIQCQAGTAAGGHLSPCPTQQACCSTSHPISNRATSYVQVCTSMYKYLLPAQAHRLFENDLSVAFLWSAMQVCLSISHPAATCTQETRRRVDLEPLQRNMRPLSALYQTQTSLHAPNPAWHQFAAVQQLASSYQLRANSWLAAHQFGWLAATSQRLAYICSSESFQSVNSVSKSDLHDNRHSSAPAAAT